MFFTRLILPIVMGASLCSSSAFAAPLPTAQPGKHAANPPKKHKAGLAPRKEAQPAKPSKKKRKRPSPEPAAPETMPVQSSRKKGPVVRMPSRSNDRSPNFDDPWPGVVIGPGKDMPFEVVEETEGNYAYKSPHFLVTANVNVGRETMKQLARRIETAYEACCALPCNGYAHKGDKRVDIYKVHFYDTMANYMKALGEGSRPSLGKTRYPEVFLNMSQLALVRDKDTYKPNPDKDPLPLVHEMHHLVGKDNADLGLWYIEGMAEYLGCTPYRDGALYFDENEEPLLEYATGHPKRYNGRGIGKKISIPSLEGFMKMAMGDFMRKRVNFNYALATLTVYYWIHLDGDGDAARLKKYVQLLQQRKGRTLAFSALQDGRSWEEIEAEFASKMAKLGLEFTFTHEQPAEQ